MGISRHIGLALMGAQLRKLRSDIVTLAESNRKLRLPARMLCAEIDRQFSALEKQYNITRMKREGVQTPRAGGLSGREEKMKIERRLLGNDGWYPWESATEVMLRQRITEFWGFTGNAVDAEIARMSRTGETLRTCFCEYRVTR